MRLVKPSPSGSPFGPSALEADVALRPFAASQPSSIPSPSVSQPATSSSAIPSPSSSLEEQSASPSLSGSAESTRPSLSSSKPFVQIFPTGSSSQRITLPTPSEPLSPQPGLLYCRAPSSFQSLTGTVPFHQTPMSRTPGVEELSQFWGCKYEYSCRFDIPSPSGSPTAPSPPLLERGSRPYCHSHPSGKPSLSESGSFGAVFMRYSKPYVKPSPSWSEAARASIEIYGIAANVESTIKAAKENDLKAFRC